MMAMRFTSNGLRPAAAGEIHGEGEDVFKHRDNCGKSGEGHEEEEQASPEPTAAHGVEYVGQGDERSGSGPLSGWTS